jgi:sugar lactone lactonase YvrE
MTGKIPSRLEMVLAAVFIAASAVAVEAPLSVRGQSVASFTRKPSIKATGGKAEISFAASVATDVEVAILDANGAVVRHLAAGLLGATAPAPFSKDSLSQVIQWDMLDDSGKNVAGNDCRVRVRLGSTAKVDRHVGWGDRVHGAIVALAVGSDGSLYVMGSETYRGGTDMRVYDKTGRYLRTIMPYSAATPRQRTASVGEIETGGERVPVIFNGLGKTTYPLTSGMRQQNMAWNPKGYLVAFSALGTMAEHGPPRHLLAIDPMGGAPESVAFVGPAIRSARGFIGGAGEGPAGCFDHLAISPDGSHIYVSVGENAMLSARKQCVYRLAWTDTGMGEPWLGKGEAGSDDEHFNGPEGLAVDAKGNVYVCDYGNNRVMVFDKEGKLLGKFAAEKPQQIEVNRSSGSIYVLSRSPNKRWGTLWNTDTAITKFSPFAGGEPRQVARLDRSGIDILAIDQSAATPKLWVAGKSVAPVIDKGTELVAGEDIPLRESLGITGFIAGDTVRNRALIYLYNTAKPVVTAVDLDSGKCSVFSPGTDMALDYAGNVYVMGGRDNSIHRYKPDGSPLPFGDAGSNRITTKGYRGYGPNMGIGGIAVDARGNILLIRNSNYGGAGSYGGRVDVYGPDGNLLKENIIDGLGYADSGLGVDAGGNIYVGSNVKPADRPIPAYFAGKAPATSWTWWRGPEREAPWRYTYYNPYLFHWGAAFKFGPEGGVFYGQNAGVAGRKDYGEARPADSAGNAPASAESLRSACLGYEVRVAGAKWRYQGCGIIPSSGDALTPDPGCVCYNSHLAVDPYGRVFLPNVFRFSVEMLDTAGNQIDRIGRYGTVDDDGAGGSNIRLAWPAFLSVNGEKLYISDSVNHRITVVRFDWAAEESAAVR